ncbi:MAG: hypothetical protein LUE25_06500 [Clostridiales bacterium]|nr:hypothetical protein [Clostridiales bacterium]
MANDHVPIKYRRRRIKRRKSTVGRAGKRQIPTAVIFVCAFVVFCIVGTVALGNYLLGKVDEGGVTDASSSTSTTSSTRYTSGISSIAAAEGNVRSGCLDISDTSDLAVIRERVDFLFECGYNAVTIPVSKYDGTLYYMSDAAVALSRMSEDENLASLSDILDVIDASAEYYGIDADITVYYTATWCGISDSVLREAAILYDTAVIAECDAAGVDEVLISYFEVTADESGIDELMSFTNKIKESAPDINLGLSFLIDIYSDTNYATLLEAAASCVSFLTVDISSIDLTYVSTYGKVYTENEDSSEIAEDESTAEETAVIARDSSIYSDLSEAAEAIKGSVSLYGLRFLLYGEDTYVLSESINAIYSAGAYNFYVITPTPTNTQEADTETGDSGETEEDTETEAPAATKAETTTTTEAPEETTTEAPVETTTETPVETTAESAEESTAETPVETTTESVEETTTEEETTTAETTTVAETTEEAPEETTDAPEETTGEADGEE